MFRFLFFPIFAFVLTMPMNCLAQAGDGGYWGDWSSLICSKVLTIDGTVVRFCQDPESGATTIWDGDVRHTGSDCKTVEMGNVLYDFCLDPENGTLTITKKHED